jgi:hypothetical protein
LLKAEPVGELLGEPVWDEGILRGISEDALELFLRYVLDAEENLEGILRNANRIKTQPLHQRAMTAAERLRTEGRQEGRQEGQLEGKRGSIRQALEIRFGAVPEPVHQKLDLIVDAKRLSDLLGESIRCQSAGDFLRHLSGLG